MKIDSKNGIFVTRYSMSPTLTLTFKQFFYSGFILLLNLTKFGPGQACILLLLLNPKSKVVSELRCKENSLK